MQVSTAGRFSRLGLYLPFAGLLVIALGWSSFWVYGRYRVGQEMDLFMSRQAEMGRIWACPDRSIAGFPFRIEVRCRKPTFRQEGADGPAAGSIEAITAIATTAGALSSGHVILEFDGPFRLTREGMSVTADWRLARSSVRGALHRLDRASFEVDRPVIEAEAAGRLQMSLRAEKLEVHLREAQGAGPGAYDAALALTNASAPQVDQILGGAEPFNLQLDARVLGMAVLDRADWRGTLERWREAGGVVRVERLFLSKGQPRGEGKGELRLDAERRITGQMDMTFTNADVLLRQFGFSAGESLIGSLLGGLGGQRAPRDAQGPARDRTLRLPVVFSEGRVAIGPFRVPGLRLQPVY